MREGALIMMDALGFKEIWRAKEIKERPEILLEQLKALEDAAQRDLAERIKHPPFGSKNQSLFKPLAVRFLSDTVIIALETADAGGGTQSTRAVFSLLLSCVYAGGIMAKAAQLSPIGLAYRGCVAYGAFAIDGNFIVGPAVDEAARMMDLAQGAFVWLTPKACDLWESLSFEGVVPVMKYDVPLKQGERFSTQVVLPFDVIDTAFRREALASSILGTFDRADGIDVKIKKQHTASFLRAAVLHKNDEMQQLLTNVPESE